MPFGLRTGLGVRQDGESRQLRPPSASLQLPTNVTGRQRIWCRPELSGVDAKKTPRRSSNTVIGSQEAQFTARIDTKRPGGMK